MPALVDVNKRLCWLAVVVFHGLNDTDLDAPDDPAYELVMSVARREMSIDASENRCDLLDGEQDGQRPADGPPRRQHRLPCPVQGRPSCSVVCSEGFCHAPPS
jgi:hypothetical protein